MTARGTGRLPKAGGTMPVDWEDKYRRLHSQHGELKGLYAELQDHNKKLQTKIRKLEADFTALGGGAPPSSMAGPPKEDEELVSKLYAENAKLKAVNTSIKEKYKELEVNLNKKKREVVMLNKKLKSGVAENTASRTTLAVSASQEIDIRAGATTKRPASAKTSSGRAPEPLSLAAADNSNLLEVARKYKTRLVTAEETIAQLRDENTRLRVDGPGSGKGKGGGDDAALRDANWRLQQLQTQYDFLVSKTSSQGQASKQVELQLEEYANKVRDLRRALEELRHEKEGSDIKAERVEELEQLNSELRRSNRSLEDKIARLCEAPFISDAFGQHESRLRFEDAAKEREEYMAKVHHLQEAVRTHFSALTSLKQHAAQLREEKEAAEKKCEEMQLRMGDMQGTSDLATEKLKLYSGDDGVDIEHLERALTLVKRRSEATSKLPFLEDPDDEGALTVPVVKRKLEEVQVMNLKLTEEVERFESMLKLQSGINKDLHKELETVVLKRDNERRVHAKKLEEFEELAKKRGEKIKSLEAQVRQLVYDVSSGGGRKGGVSNRKFAPKKEVAEEEKADPLSVDPGQVLLKELLEEGGGELNPDHNLLEVWVKNATIAPESLPSGSSSFLVIDFFDYESQTTTLLTGNKPGWDFAASYKVFIDDFFLRYLATDVVTIELNAATQGEFTMLARASIPLSALLKSKPFIQLSNLPMLSVRTGEIIAHINAEIRLALPVSELFRLFLERHPSEKRLIQDRSNQKLIDATSAVERGQKASMDIAAAKADESRLYNDLEIAILKCDGLPLIAGKAPTAYVHFQFLGHPDKYTNPVPDDANPVFNERFSFATITNEQQVRLMRRSKLSLSVIDMNTEDAGTTNEGMIGEVYIPLAELSEGQGFQDEFSIKDADGNKLGTITVGARWKYAFREERDLGPRGLSAMEVETVISAFSARDISEGVVDYRAFCRFMDPDPDVHRMINRLRNHADRVGENEGRPPRDVFTVLFHDTPTLDDAQFLSKIEMAKIDALPEDLNKLFRYIDRDEDNCITTDQLLDILNLDDSSPIPIALHDKLRERIADLHARGIYVDNMFSEVDQWGAQGLVTRLDFKEVLRKMGFFLADETEIADPSTAKFVQLGANDASSTVPDAIREAFGDKLDVTDDDILSEDKINSMAAAGASSDEIKKQRDLFEQRSKEAMQRRQEAIDLAAESKGDKSKEEDPRLSRVKSPAVATHSSVTATHNRRVEEKPLSPSPRPGPDDAPVPGESAIVGESPPHSSTTLGKPSSILSAEQIIRTSLRKLEGLQPEPNVIGGFHAVDTKRSGVVNRTQFAHVMKQFQSQIALTGEDLRACMDYFDSSNDGSKIKYEPFCRFIKCREPDLMPAHQRLQKIVLGPAAVREMKALDGMGSGSVKRSDMLRAMSSLGYDHVGSATMLSILELFETKVEGQVNYGNFFEYVRENDLCRSLDEAASKLFELVTGRGMSVNATVNIDDFMVRDWFDKIDGEGRGKISAVQLDRFLSNMGYPSSKEVAQCLVGQMCQQGRTEVNAGDFTAWVTALPITQSQAISMYSTPGVGEIRRKAHAYMLVVAKAGSPTLTDVSESFSIYDWERPQRGTLDKDIFFHACARAGFVFTIGELRTLVSEFGKDGTNVQYRRFLEWATPDADVGTQVAGPGGDTVNPRGNSVGALIKFLERKMLAEVDLLSVFGRYDKKGTGHVTIDEFCAAFSDLGVSSVTHKEALDLVDRFSASINNFVMYRRIVTELLRQVDEATGASAVDPVDVVRAALQRGKVEVRRLRDVFEYYDRKSTGRVREDDLGTIFEEAQVKLRRSELDAVVDKYCISGGSSAGSTLVSYNALLTAVETAMTDFGAAAGSKASALSEDARVRMREMFDSLILRGIDFRAEFDRLDGDDFSGTVTQQAFRDLMADKFRSSLSPRDVDSVEKTYRDPNDPRRINFLRLIYDLHPRYFSTGGTNTGNDSWEIAESLRSKVRRRCNYLSAGELRRPFRHFARRKGERGVSMDDFSVGIRDLGIRAASDQVQEIFDSINTTGTNEFDYGDFLVFVKDPLNADVLWKLRRLLSRNRVSDEEVLNSFKEQDRNESGLLSFSQVEKCFRYCSIELTDADVSRLMVKFDPAENQRFDVRLFSRFLKGQSTTGDAAKATKGADDVETKAWSYLRQRVLDKLETGFSANEVFGYFDRDRRDTIDIAGLQDGAQQLSAPLSRPEARGIMRRMSLLAGGAVDKKAFYECLEVDTSQDYRKSRDSRDRDARDRGARDRDDYDGRDRYRDRREDLDRDVPQSQGADSRRDLEETCTFLRKDLEGQRAVLDGELPEDVLARALTRAATGNDKVTQGELTSAFDMLGLRASDRDIIKIFQQLDPTFTDKVAVQDLVAALYPNASASRSPRNSGARRSSRDSTNAQALFKRRPDILQLFQERITSERDVKDLMQEFEDADRGRTGELERGEFGKALVSFGFRLSRAEERDVTDSLGDGRSGIDYRDVVASLEYEVAKDEQTDDIIIRLQKRLSRDEKHGRTLMDAFERFDRDKNGEIDIDEMESAMRSMGIPLERDESRRIVQKFSVRGNTIKYAAFVQVMSGAEFTSQDSVASIIDRLQRVLERRLGSAANAAREIKESFADFDKNNDGTVTKTEFANAMASLKLDVSRDNVDLIFKKYDDNGDGKIDYDNFLRILDFAGGSTSSKGHSDPERGSRSSRRPERRDLDRIVDRVRRRIEDNLGSGGRVARRVKEVFSDIDRNGNNLLEKREFSDAMRALKVNLDAEDLDTLYDYYDADHNGGLDYTEFVRLLGFEEQRY